MFLALREIRHSPTRFILITVVIFLVSYLVYFLTGLAYGLASSYTEAIDEWDTSYVVVSEDANRNLVASRITETTATEVSAILPESTPLLARPVVYEVPESARDGETDTGKRSAFLFGVDEGEPASVPVVEGRYPAETNEILLDEALRAEGYAVGDTLELIDSETTWTISGFTDSRRFQVAPTFYIPREHFQEVFAFALASRDDTVVAQALMLDYQPPATDLEALSDLKLEALSIDELIEELPGYRAQTLTFTLMIGSLIAILSFVLGIFIYVLTLQKRMIFGIMKAQGIPTSYILSAGTIQTLLLTIVGVGSGVGLAWLTGYFLQGKVPFQVDLTLFGIVTGAFFLFTLIGALSPIRTISRIDPLEAIG